MKAPVFELTADHPGVSDPEYLARRATIASASEHQSPGATPPAVTYTRTEDDVWHTVSTALRELHQEYAIDEYRRGAAALRLPSTRVPQLAAVSERLHALTGWRVEAVPGLVPTRTFYGSLARRTFLSTQYVRHPSVPFYTPEPDIIHELIGHVNALASPRIAAMYEAAGRASIAAVDDAALDRFSRVFWFTLEFGLVREHDELRTYGAGLLSSFGEIQAFRNAEVRPFDLDQMATLDYDITHFQKVLFAADSFDDVESALLAYFAAF
jgi:phenylalanine-4-hydroxylase